MNNKYPIIMSIPKSGTHLIMKLMTLLTNGMDHRWNFGVHNQFEFKSTYTPGEKLYFEEKIDEYISNDKLVVFHSNVSEPYKSYINKHPEQKTILQVRDLRDVFVSLLLGYKNLKNELLDVKLMNLIKAPEDYKTTFNIYMFAKNMVDFIKTNKDNVYICKFEKLIGNNGHPLRGSSVKKTETKVSDFCN